MAAIGAGRHFGEWVSLNFRFGRRTGVRRDQFNGRSRRQADTAGLRLGCRGRRAPLSGPPASQVLGSGHRLGTLEELVGVVGFCRRRARVTRFRRYGVRRKCHAPAPSDRPAHVGLAAKSGCSSQIGETQMAFRVGAAMRGLAASASTAQITRGPSRRATRAFRHAGLDPSQSAPRSSSARRW
jgi:hypothetical protein